MFRKFTDYTGKIALLILVFILIAVANGWALFKLWGWFMESATPLSLVQAISITMGISFLTSDLKPEIIKNKDFSDLIGQAINDIIVQIGRPLIVVGTGWFVSGLL